MADAPSGKKRKGNSGSYKKGQSGNLKGRPRKFARFDTPQSIEGARLRFELTMDHIKPFKIGGKTMNISGLEAVNKLLLAMALNGNLGAIKYLKEEYNRIQAEKQKVRDADIGLAMDLDLVRGMSQEEFIIKWRDPEKYFREKAEARDERKAAEAYERSRKKAEESSSAKSAAASDDDARAGTYPASGGIRPDDDPMLH